MYEEEIHGHTSKHERWAKRRVKLGDRLTKEMTSNAGLTRLYKNEKDFFFGSAYGVVPDYWDPSMSKPTGSPEVAKYFDNNPHVKKLTLDMLNVFKSEGVHAGGVCFGRQSFERVPLRPDKHGYVAQLEMKWIEYTGVLKFDVLGLSTLTQISETLKMMVDEYTPQQLSYLPEDIYYRVKGGQSTDIMWRHIPLSTPFG